MLGMPRHRHLTFGGIFLTCTLNASLAGGQSEPTSGVNTSASSRAVSSGAPNTRVPSPASTSVVSKATTKPKRAAPLSKAVDSAPKTENKEQKVASPVDVTDAGPAKVDGESSESAAGDDAVTEEVRQAPVGPLVVPPPPPPPQPLATVSSDTSTATLAAPVTPPPPSIGVTYLNRAVFLLASDGTKVAKERAKRLSEALKAAIQADNKASPDAPNVELLNPSPGNVEMRVRGHLVGVLTDKDALAAGHADMASYSKALDEGLELFVADQRRKIALQGVAARVAIALGVSLIGLFFLRLAQVLFQRADEYIDEHSSSIRPFRVLGVPVIGVEGLSAVITFTVAIGRIATLLSIVVVTMAVALAQFELTRPWIAVAMKWSTARVLHGIEELVLILPRLLLAAALLLTGSAAVRVARVLFDDTTTTATPWGTVSRRRARVLRILIPIGVFLVVVPLVIAAVFGHFHTPLELLILALVVGASLGLAPLVAAVGIGLAAMWHGVLLNGDHISIGRKRGRLVRMNPLWVELEDENGLREDVPLFSLFNASITHHLEPASQRIRVKIKRPPDIPAALESLLTLVKEVCAKRTVECTGFDVDHAEFVVDVWAEPLQMADLVKRLADPQAPHPVLELTRLDYPDMVRGPV